MIAEVDVQEEYEDAVEGVYRAIHSIALLAIIALAVSTALMLGSYDRIIFDPVRESDSEMPAPDDCDARAASATGTTRTLARAATRHELDDGVETPVYFLHDASDVSAAGSFGSALADALADVPFRSRSLPECR